jgi:hypothetical protein
MVPDMSNTVARFRQVVPVAEKVLRVELLVALVPGQGAVKLRSTMLGHQVDLRATFEPVFSRVGVRLDVNLG